MKTLRLSLLAATAATPLLAQDHREMGAHVHGVSQLQIAMEHGHLEMNLTSPGMDIVGFEYDASTAQDKDAVEAAIRTLIQPEKILVPAAAAECRLTEVLAHLHADDHGHHGDDHEGHGHDHDKDHDHDEDHADHEGHEKHEHDEDHKDHDDHAHEDEGAHSEFHARYKYTCEHPEKLTSIDLPFFGNFANAQEVEATYITQSGAGQAEVSRDAAKLTLD